jgi:hypothetical protein
LVSYFMVADETGRSPAPSTTRVRLRWLGIVVAVMAALTAGWPLLNSAVANRQPLARGAEVTIGSGRASSGTVTVGPGWFVQPMESNPGLQYVLRKGAIVLYLRHVSLVGRTELSSMWRGMRQVVSVTNPGSVLSAPVSTTLPNGLRAVTGTVSGPQLVGTFTIVPGPSGKFAITMIVLAPRRTSTALRAAAGQVVRSLELAEPSR